MNHLTTPSKYDTKCPVYGKFNQEVITVFEYSFDNDNTINLDNRHYDLDVNITDINDCIFLIEKEFSEGMNFIYSVEENEVGYISIKLRYTDLQEEYLKGQFHEYVFTV